MDLSEYKDILGKPREGIHKWRLFGVAGVDTLGTIGLAFLLTKYAKIPISYSMVGLFGLAIIAHKAFGVDIHVD